MSVDSEATSFGVHTLHTESTAIMATSRTGTGKWRALRLKAINQAKRQGVENCPRCGIILDYSSGPKHRASVEADHVTPYSRGGTDSLDNIQIVCMRCNRSMGDKRTYRPRTPATAPSVTLVTSRQW